MKTVASAFISITAIWPKNSMAFMQSIVKKATVIVSATLYSPCPAVCHYCYESYE